MRTTPSRRGTQFKHGSRCLSEFAPQSEVGERREQGSQPAGVAMVIKGK